MIDHTHDTPQESVGTSQASVEYASVPYTNVTITMERDGRTVTHTFQAVFPEINLNIPRHFDNMTHLYAHQGSPHFTFETDLIVEMDGTYIRTHVADKRDNVNDMTNDNTHTPANG